MEEKLKIIAVLVISSLFILYGWLLLYKTSDTVSKFAEFSKKITLIDWENRPKTAFLNSLAKHPEKHPSLIRNQKISGCVFMIMGIMGVTLIVLMLFFNFS